MFAWILLGILLAISVAITIGVWSEDGRTAGIWVLFIALLISFGSVGGWSIGCSQTRQVKDFTRVKELDKKVVLYTQKKNNLTMVVRAELSKYPEYEKAIIGKINPAILLNFPKLKSNETMMETLKRLLELENKVYDLREKLIEVQREMYHREISPWVIYVKPYSSFLGKPNPITQ